jgi:hypothetical protein
MYIMYIGKERGLETKLTVFVMGNFNKVVGLTVCLSVCLSVMTPQWWAFEPP